MTTLVFTAADYAGIEGDGFTFYYGYEYAHRTPLMPAPDDDETEPPWGFYYEAGGTRLFGLAHEEMAAMPGCPDRFECQECLAFGMMLFIRLNAHPPSTSA